MDSTSVILDIIRLTLPGVIVLIATSLIINKFLSTQMRMKQFELFHETQEVTLRLRLQAYERLVIFLERISPRQLLPRIYSPSMTVFELQQAITFNVLTEFDHNLSQQIYVSPLAWDAVRNVKEQTINMGIAFAQKLDQDASAKALYAMILEYMATTENELPVETALKMVKDEVRKAVYAQNVND